MRSDCLRLQEARAFHCRSDVLQADDVEAEREEDEGGDQRFDRDDLSAKDTAAEHRACVKKVPI